MDRTDELIRATQLFQSIDRSKSTVRGGEPSPFLTRSTRVSVDLEQNGNAERKEFSNDPVHEMKKISTSFQTNINNVENDIVRLKKEVDSGVQGNTAIQHRKLILEYLEKLMRRHVSSFKDAVKTYTANVEQRNKRVGNKYGQVAGIISLTSENASKYAMFSAPLQLEPDPYSAPGNTALRNRRGGASVAQTEVSAYVAEDFTDEVTFGSTPDGPASGNSKPGANSKEDDYENDKKYGKGGRPPPLPQPVGSAPSSGGFGSAASAPSYSAGSKPYSRAGNRGSGTSTTVGGAGGANVGTGQQAQAQVQQKGRGRELDRYRLQQAQQAESTIAQMGQLFAQMATLVSEQSETIARIEDDVEAGLQDTLQGQAHIQNVYDITKGNRGLILKIFALLVFFIFLFLVWT